MGKSGEGERCDVLNMYLCGFRDCQVGLGDGEATRVSYAMNSTGRCALWFRSPAMVTPALLVESEPWRLMS